MNINYEYTKHKHIGSYIREEILPANLSVSKAAQILDVGRPALSNLLNGNASLSHRMALKLEKVFNADASELLYMQTRYSEKEARAHENNIVVQKYIPAYRQITAHQIETWANTKDARGQLPALLRTLVHTTGSNLTAVDFPAFKNSERPGWDGQINSNEATSWIPLGRSGWEFSCTKNIEGKANSDYEKRTESISSKITTFVFVTPRDWKGKNKWKQKKNSTGQWNEVRAYDANDLEQWIETSTEAQLRFREFNGDCDPAGVETPSQVWQEWANVTNPELLPSLFDPSIKQFQNQIENWLKAPPNKPFVIEAHSRLEALAFLNCALERIAQSCPRFYEQTVVIHSKKAFNKFAAMISNQIVVLAYDKVEKALAFLRNKTHTIIVRVRGQNTLSKDANISLGLLSYPEFYKALLDMQIEVPRIKQLARESACSPTILRRRLAVYGNIMKPRWATKPSVARAMVPFIFVGMWDSKNEADKEVLEHLSNQTYKDLEKSFVDIQSRDETPVVWSIHNHKGVVAKIDALYAVNWAITIEDLENFLLTAEAVLSVKDPASKLPQHKPFLSKLFNLSRGHSPALRQGILDTLVLLAVFGDNYVGDYPEINLEASIGQLVSRLLSHSTKSDWLSQAKDLPSYAEAAPDKFLKIIEEDLKSDDPYISVLFEIPDINFGNDCPRLGLLWSLELLAWNPDHLSRVVEILTKLSYWKIKDNSINTPMNSLKSIFRRCMPQTTASLDQRNKSLKRLTKKFPDVVWQICVYQFNPMSKSRIFNHKPRWRTDAYQTSKFTSMDEDRCKNTALELSLNWPKHDEQTLGDLIEHQEELNNDQYNLMWKLIQNWYDTNPTDDKKSELREQIRCFVPILNNRRRNTHESGNNLALQIYELLKPQDLIIRYQWLFLNDWVHTSADERESAQLDIEAREEQVANQRVNALREIWDQLGLEGIKKLCQSNEAAHVIGSHIARTYTGIQEATNFVKSFFTKNSNKQEILTHCIVGFLSEIKSQDRNTVFIELLSCSDFSEDDCIRFLHCSPFNSDTLQHVYQLKKDLRLRYWEEMIPKIRRPDASIITTLVDELTKIGRVHDAFHATKIYWRLLDSHRLIGLLKEVAKNNKTYPIRLIDDYSISEALNTLIKRNDTSPEDWIEIEFTFIEVLYKSNYGIPNLEECLSKSPELFMYALTIVTQRDDGNEDQDGFRRPNFLSDTTSKRAAYLLLISAKRVPGTQSDGSIDSQELMEWLVQVRRLTSKYGRSKIGDVIIGQLLSHCPVGEDGIWPCKPMCEAIDDIESDEISLGIISGVKNDLIVRRIAEYSVVEHELAEQYEHWAQKVSIEYPFTGRMLKEIKKSYKDDAKWLDYWNSIVQRLNL